MITKPIRKCLSWVTKVIARVRVEPMVVGETLGGLKPSEGESFHVSDDEALGNPMFQVNGQKCGPYLQWDQRRVQ